MVDGKEKPEKVRVLGIKDDGRMLIVDDSGEVSSTRPLKAGVPLDPSSDVVEFEATDRPHVLTKRVLYKGKGPAKVSSPAFREGWDEVFGKAPRREDMN